MIKDYLQSLREKLAAGDSTEHTHRSTLEALVKSFGKELQVSNEPKRIKVGAPDLIVRKKIARDELLPVGYIETKDIGADLNKIEKSEQLQRYFQLPNLILTDYLEFRWYVGGKKRRTVTLASKQGKKIKVEKDGEAQLAELFESFLAQDVTDINNPRELAQRMAGLCRNIDRIITETFAAGEASDLMNDLKGAFSRTLLPEISDVQFADMFAQTLGYGLFAARIHHHQMRTPPIPPVNGGEFGSPSARGGMKGGSDSGLPPFTGGQRGVGSTSGREFTRMGAAREIPKSNPFLRDLFDTIHSSKLEDEPFIEFVDDLTAVLAHTDVEAVLAQFGKRSGQEDPILHFYETFLAAYDPAERKRRGVYYTPEPVVSYIVRSVDILLKEKFGLADGLADESTVEVEVKEGDKFVKRTLPKVLILDPACGTGTFLYAVVDLIRSRFMERNRAGEWRSFVREHLIPRIYGFELQMAPYAVAHLKLAMQLAGQDLPEAQRKKWGYDFGKDERLNVYLTNSLEETIHKAEEFFGTMKIITQEANAASNIKMRLPIMVVLGNPPYSGHSANKGEWIGKLIRDYYFVDGEPLGEKNPKWLQDDYVKFLRYGQWRIAQWILGDTRAQGILAFITNHSYLDNPTFRGMRRSLQQTFDEIYVLDLHGNSKKKEKAPGGGKDENVFDIQQGVAVGLFVKSRTKSKTVIRRGDVWGEREGKYKWLAAHDHTDSEWAKIEPDKPFYLFRKTDKSLKTEYNQFLNIRTLFEVNGVGMTTARDGMVTDFDMAPLIERTRTFRDSKKNDNELCELLSIPLKKGWSIPNARNLIKKVQNITGFVKPLAYRPFDNRLIFYHDSLVWRTVKHVMRHMLAGENIALCIGRAGAVVGGDEWNIIFCSRYIDDFNLFYRGGNLNLPLYLYPEDGSARKPNLDPKCVAEIAEKLGMTFVDQTPPIPIGKQTPPIPPVNGGGSESPSACGGMKGGSESGLPPLAGGQRGVLIGGGQKRVGKNISWEDVPPAHWQFAREMRKEPSAAEKKLWQALRHGQLGADFRRQHPIGPFIADFYCTEAALVVEVDGDTHANDEAQQYDSARDGYMRERGLKVIRFINSDVLKSLAGVVEAIKVAIAQTPPIPALNKTPPIPALNKTPPIPPVNGGEEESDIPPLAGGLRGVGSGSEGEFGPEDIFYYIYAVFHSPTYRERYKEFLKIDFPRVPLTGNRDLFGKLVSLGHELTQFHLLEHPALNDTPIVFPEPGDNIVEKVAYDENKGRVSINKTQYFQRVAPEVWAFHVGGYQVCQKWLKDRKGRALSHDDVRHYEKTVTALGETIRLMKEIDAAIPQWPME